MHQMTVIAFYFKIQNNYKIYFLFKNLLCLYFMRQFILNGYFSVINKTSYSAIWAYTDTLSSESKQTLSLSSVWHFGSSTNTFGSLNHSCSKYTIHISKRLNMHILSQYFQRERASLNFLLRRSQKLLVFEVYLTEYFAPWNTFLYLFSHVPDKWFLGM